MLDKLLDHRNKRKWLKFHIFLGIISTINPLPLIIWFYYVFTKSVSLVFSSNILRRNIAIIYLIVYLVPFELLARMAQTPPLIPYELSKYLMFLLLGYAILRNGLKGKKANYLLLFSLLPALFFDLSGQVRSSDIVFNLFGPINLALAVIYFSNIVLTPLQLKNILGLILYSLLCVLVYTYVKTPSYDEIEFSLGANFSTTGGFGSNQVSTALGLGAFLVFLFWLNRWKWSGSRKLDAFLLFGFIFQGLLTFSRGGMLGGAMGIIIVGWYVSKISKRERVLFRFPDIKRYIIPVLLLIGTAFALGNQITNGKLLLRYQGETHGTLTGSKEKSLNVITTNRYDILLGDIDLLFEYPISGVGAGASRYLRRTHAGTLAHVEFSRLLAEHGLFGLLHIVILLGLFLNFLNNNKDRWFNTILLALFLIGIYTSFHAAMRTFVTPLLIGLSQVKLKE